MLKESNKMCVTNIKENIGERVNKIERCNVLDMLSNHALKGLNKDLTTTNTPNQLLATTQLKFPQSQNLSLDISPSSLLHHTSHSLNMMVLPYGHQKGETKAVIDSLFIQMKGGQNK